MLTVRTETGSVYEITDLHVRRVGTHDMRRDGDWVKLLTPPDPVVGRSMVLFLEPLGDGDVTVRTTSPVVDVSHMVGRP